MARCVGAVFIVLAWSVPSVGAEPGLYGGVWRAEEIRGHAVADDARLTLSIAPDGTVSGSGGCNRFMGTAVIDGNDVSFPPFAASKKMCAAAVMIPEQEFLGALGAAASYRLRGSDLLLYDAEGMQRIKMTRSE